MVHCPICYYTQSTCAWNLSCKCKLLLRYDTETKIQGKSNLTVHLGVCGCDKCVWVQQHGHYHHTHIIQLGYVIS